MHRWPLAAAFDVTFALIVASIRIEACAHILSGVIYGLLKLANGVFVKRLLILLLFSPSPLFAQSPFDGTWIINSDTAQLPEKPQVYVLAEGVFDAQVACRKSKSKQMSRIRKSRAQATSTQRAFESWMPIRLNSSPRKKEKRCSRNSIRFRLMAQR